MSYRCGGILSYSGPCGAVDCASCNPSSYRRAEQSLMDDQKEEQEDDGLSEHERFMKAFEKKPPRPKLIVLPIEDDDELPF